MELCAQVTELIRGSQVLSPVLSGSRVHCSVAVSSYQGSLSLKSAGHVGDVFLHLEPLSSHALCLRTFQTTGALSGVCLLELV